MQDLLREVLHEITAAPVRFAAEVAQSMLVVVVAVLAGRGIVAKRLTARRARIAAELEEAEAAERRWAGIREEARAVVAEAEQEAPAILRAARERAESERAASGAQIEGEAREIITRARDAVEAEKSRVVRETANRLIQLTADTTRRYLDEMLSESERRELMQRAILAGVDELGPQPPPGGGAT